MTTSKSALKAPQAPAQHPGPAAPSTGASGSASVDVKGKRKRQADAADEDEDEDEEADADDAAEPQWHKEGDEDGKTPGQGDWQAVWSVQANAYYFWNQKTNETTWTNPLQPAADTAKAEEAAAPPALSAHVEARPKEYGGIDPDLAYLDPSLAYGPKQGLVGAQTARFNARTGRFEGGDARTPGHVSDLERYKRQSAFFFDVEGWEKQTDAEQERRKADIAAGIDPDANRQRPPTKAELQRYKERAAEKKRAKRQWLYE